MPSQLVYGANQRLPLELPEKCRLAELGASPGAPLSDPAAASAAAVSDPLEFPPLTSAAIPGDRVVLTLEHGTPQSRAIIAGIVHVLVQSGVYPSDISIVLAEHHGGDAFDPTELIDPEYRQAIVVERHDCRVEDSLAYLAATRDGRPVYLNRRVCDADVVIPIGVVRHDAQPDYFGVYGSLFPGLTDAETQTRYQSAGDARWRAEAQQRREEAAEAAWLLGVQFTVQVVPAGSDGILHVVAGEAGAVAREGQRLYRAAWQAAVADRADLVVATIEGGEEHQTWANVGRALHAASLVVSNQGAIVICCDLHQPPGVALRKAAAPYLPDFEHLFDEDEPLAPSDVEQALSASMLSTLLETNRIYLLSRLEENDVEDLAMAYVEEPSDVARLAGRFEHCLLLANSQFVIPTLSNGASNSDREGSAAPSA
ncbi:MAG: lactate racemase domain-containing protein [Pirellulaceae bacterium]